MNETVKTISGATVHSLCVLNSNGSFIRASYSSRPVCVCLSRTCLFSSLITASDLHLLYLVQSGCNALDEFLAQAEFPASWLLNSSTISSSSSSSSPTLFQFGQRVVVTLQLGPRGRSPVFCQRFPKESEPQASKFGPVLKSIEALSHF